MQNDSKAPPRPVLRIDTLGATLKQKLDNEIAVLEVLVGALAKGQSHPELWSLLHEAALRDDRLAELAFAYERMSQDRRAKGGAGATKTASASQEMRPALKTLVPTAQAEALMHAAVFFEDVFGDSEGALGYLEKVVALAPGNAAAFARLEHVLAARGEGLRLSELYAATAALRTDRQEQLRLLRRAIEICDGFSGEEERTLKLCQQILRIDPGDTAARDSLEARFMDAGRFSDVVKLLEQGLLGEQPEEQATRVRARLIDLYVGELHELERAMPHVEEVLKRDPAHLKARGAGVQLLAHKATAARAAAALEGAYERRGELQDAARMLGVEVEHLRGPKRIEAQKRLALLKLNRLGDPAGALLLFEAVVTADPADEEVRGHFLHLCASQGRQLDATRVLSRAATGAKDPGLRARIGAEVGSLWLAIGDVKKARTMFQGVLDGGGDDGAVREAARAMAALAREAKEHRLLASVLDRLSQIEPDPGARAAAAEQLALLCEGELKDPAGAITAWRRLEGTALAAPALAALERLYEATGNHAGLVGVLERRAGTLKDRTAARALSLRAAELASTKLTDRAAAIAAWRKLLVDYGPARDAHAQLIPLLEQERRWDELAGALWAEAALVPVAERVPLLARLAQIRLTRLRDDVGALDAYRQALKIDPTDRPSRLAVEKLLASGDHRLAAAEVMEPLYRAEGAAAGLSRALEIRGTLGDSARVRMAALEEAVELIERELRDPKRALGLAAQGLKEAVAGRARASFIQGVPGTGEIMEWLERVDALAPAGGDAARRAAILVAALGDHPIDQPALADLARRAGEALVQATDVAQALAVYRRALAFEPSSADLLARVDSLLKEQGSPAERVALFQAALVEPCAPARRRELLHAIGSIQRRDLGDVDAAIATYRQALSEDPGDRAAYEALLEAHAAAGAWDALYEELGRGLEALGESARDQRASLMLRMAEVSVASGHPARAVLHYRELLAGDIMLGEATLDIIERVAESEDHAELLRDVLLRRVSLAIEPLDEALLLERLGEVEAERLEKPALAVASWKRGARLAEGAAADAEGAQRLYERVLTCAPDDREAAERLVDLYRRAGAWLRLVGAYDVLLRSPKSDAEAVDLLLALEEPAIRARATDRFLVAARAVLEREGISSGNPRRGAILAAQARVLAADPERQPAAAAAYREMIEAAPEDPAPAADAFEAFLLLHVEPRDASQAGGAAREWDQHRRWLAAFRAEHAPEADRVRAILAWAAIEEGVIGDAAAAVEVYTRALGIDPDLDVALAAIARLKLTTGDVEGAAQAVAARRDRSEGSARSALNLELASLLLDHLERPEDALDAVAPVLESAPADAAALRIVERALARPRTRARAAALLERACDAVEDADLSVALYQVLLSTPADAPELEDARPRWFERLLDRYAERPEEALTIALRAAAELPHVLSLWDRAERLGRELQRVDLIAEVYRRELASEAAGRLDADVIEALGRRAVEYHEEWFDDAESVVTLLLRVSALAPDATWAFERLKLTFNAAERWDELFALYDQAIDRAEDGAVRVELLEDAAQAAKDFAFDAARAIRYLEQILPYKRDDARITDVLERLYERHGRFRPLIDLLALKLPALEREPAQQLRARIVALWLDGVGDAVAALEEIERMLALEPDRAQAFDLLEKVLATTAGMEPAEPAIVAAQTSVRQRAAVRLEQRYRSIERTPDLVRTLEVELESASNAKDRARRLKEILALRQGLGDQAGALETMAALMAAEPRVGEHRRELFRQASLLGRWDRFVEALASLAARSDDKKLKIQLLSEAAAVHREQLNDPDMAIDLSRVVLELAEANEDAAAMLASARELEALLSVAGREAERCEVLERLASLEPDAAAKRAALGAAAELARTALADPHRAARAWRRRLAADAGDHEALDGLVDALEAVAEWRELIAALERRAAGAEAAASGKGSAPGDGGRADRARVARILGERLYDRPAAITAWTSVRESFGADDESCDALAQLYTEEERWADLTELYELSARAARDPARSAALWRRLGDVHRERTGAIGQAIASYEAALAHDVRDPAARRGLEALFDRVRRGTGSAGGASDEATAALVRLLERVYAEIGDTAGTIGLLEARVAVASESPARVAILVETTRLLEARGDPSAAFETTWRAFALAPQPIAEDLIRLATAANRWGDVARDLASVIEAPAEPAPPAPPAEEPAPPAEEPAPRVTPPVARDLWWNVARWRRDHGGDPAAAEAAFARALACDPRNVEILAALAEIQRRSPGRALISTLLQLSDATGGDLDLDREAVEIASRHVLDPVLAAEIAERMLASATARWAAPEPATGEGSAARSPQAAVAAAWALDELVRLGREAEDTARVIALYLRGARLPFPPAEQRQMRLLAADLADVEAAITIYRALFDEDPADAHARQRLEVLYRQEGRREDLLRLRERQIESSADAASRAMLRLDAASLLAEGDEIDRAIGMLEESLAEVPDHAPSAARLAELLAMRGRHADLARLCEEQAEHREAAGDGEGAAELWMKAAALSERELADPDRAVVCLRRAAVHRGIEPLLDLARIHASRGEHAAAAEVLEQVCARAPTEPLILRLADAHVAAGDPGKAAAQLEQAAGLEGGAAIRERLEALYREAQSWGPLADLIAGIASRAPDKATRFRRLREAADLNLHQRRDPAAAIPLLEQAADLYPEDTSVRLAISAALSAAGRFEDATTILKGLIQAYGARRPKDRALVHYELARVALASGERARALGELDAALKIDPAHPDILHALAKLALEEGQLDRAARTYRALLLVLKRTKPSDADAVGRVEVMLELSDIARHQGEPDRASEFLESAFEAARDSAAEGTRMLRALRAKGRHETLARALEMRISEAPPPAEPSPSRAAAEPGEPSAPGIEHADPGDRAALLQELAAIYEEHLGRPADALDARLRALALLPWSEPAHRAALALSSAIGQQSRYLDAAARLIEAAADPLMAIDLHLHLGRAHEGIPGGDARAAEIYRRAEELVQATGAAPIGEPARPTSAPAASPRLDEIWRVLDRVYGRLGDVDAQAAVLEKRAAASAQAMASPEERADPLYRMAAIQLSRPGRQDEGALLLTRAMELSPQPDRAEDALRAAARVDSTNEGVLRLFERLSRENGRERALIDALILLAELEGEGTSGLREAVLLSRRLGDRPLAEAILRRVLAQDPAIGATSAALAAPSAGAPPGVAPDPGADDLELPAADPPPDRSRASIPPVDDGWALIALAELRAESGDLKEAAALEEIAARLAPPDQERALLLHVASLAAGPLMELRRAAQLYEELRQREPADREVWEPLAEVYRKLGDRARLSALIADTVPLVDTVAERGRLRLERAKILIGEESLQATPLLYEILEEDPGDVDAAMLLLGLLEKAGKTDELADLLARQIDAAKDRQHTASVVALSTRLGALLEHRGDDHGALDVYHAALDWDGGSREALRAIVRLSVKRDDSIDLGEALEKLLAVEQGEDAALLAIRLAEMRELHGDDAGAEAALAVGYQACPQSDRLRDELIRRYTAREDWRKLAHVHVLDAATRRDVSDRVECLCCAADILRSRAGDARAAAEILEGARAADPTDRDVLLALIDAYSALGEHSRAIAAISAALAHAEGDAWLYRSRASLYDALSEDDLALADLEQANEKSGGGYASELIAQIERSLGRLQAGAVSTRRDERDLLLWLAAVLQRSGDLDRARDHLLDLVRRSGKDRAALRALASLEDTAQRWDASSATYRRLLALEDGEALVETAMKLADACERGDRLADARGALERALRVAPSNSAVRERLRKVYGLTGAYRELAALVLEDAAAASDVAGRWARLLQAGRFLLDAGDEAARAVEVLEEARSLRPEEQEGALLLADALAASGRRADAIAQLQQAAAVFKGRRAKPLAAIYRRIAKIELGDGDLSEAMVSLSRALDNDPQNGPLAMELGLFAVDLDDHEVASRAFRSVTLMKATSAGPDLRPGSSSFPPDPDGAVTSPAKALAYYHLGLIARGQGDRRKARVMAEKAVAEDAGLEVARALLDELRAG